MFKIIRKNEIRIKKKELKLTFILSGPKPGDGHPSKKVAKSWSTCSNTRYTNICRSFSSRRPWQISNSLMCKGGKINNIKYTTRINKMAQLKIK